MARIIEDITIRHAVLQGINVLKNHYSIACKANGTEMATTAYYDSNSSTEAVNDDVNSRVKGTPESAEIEIPNNYVNVMMKQRDYCSN